MDIDGLVDALSAQASVNEPGVYDASGPHPRFALYKSNNYAASSQEKRRQDLLERQKSARFESIQNARNLPADLENEQNADGSEDQQNEESMEVTRTRSDWYRSNGPRLKAFDRFRDQLMLSEWLVDVPDDFASNWLMVPSPEGRRLLVVAVSGYTYSFSKTGYQRHNFVSLLPGGNKNSCKYETWLDCIFCGQSGTFYVLDCICWKDQSIADGERNFRYFWLKSQFDNEPHLSEVSSRNKFKFVLLPQYSCDVKNIEAAINEDFPYTLDGLLFYCNDAYYTGGLTPLVGWLKPFMLTEILKVENLPAKFRDGPTAAEFIRNFNEAEENRRKPAARPNNNTNSDPAPDNSDDHSASAPNNSGDHSASAPNNGNNSASMPSNAATEFVKD